jgi:predicted membrane chloride channel (bestrophin family)
MPTRDTPAEIAHLKVEIEKVEKRLNEDEISEAQEISLNQRLVAYINRLSSLERSSSTPTPGMCDR